MMEIPSFVFLFFFCAFPKLKERGKVYIYIYTGESHNSLKEDPVNQLGTVPSIQFQLNCKLELYQNLPDGGWQSSVWIWEDSIKILSIINCKQTFNNTDIIENNQSVCSVFWQNFTQTFLICIIWIIYQKRFRW